MHTIGTHDWRVVPVPDTVDRQAPGLGSWLGVDRTRGQRMLRIYGRANSINVRKVLWLCDELGLPYEREDWGRGTQSTSDLRFTRLSNFGVVPVVDDDGFILRESNSIVRYLATKHARTDLYPVEPKARAIVEQWMDYASADLATGMRIVYQGKDLKLPPWADDKLVIWAIAEWNKQLQRIDKHLAETGPYVTGRPFTIGDIPLGLMVNRWTAIDFDKPKLPAVAAYYARLCDRPGFQAHGCNGMA